MIVPLTAADVTHVSLVVDSYFSRHTLADHVHVHTGLSWRNSLYEYVVGGNWKCRPEIGEVLELGRPARGAFRVVPITPGRALQEPPWTQRRAALVERLEQAYTDRGAGLILLADREAVRNWPAYQELGWQPVEQIVYYRRPHVRVEPGLGRLHFKPFRQRDVERLMLLEQATFPWMWWYGLQEWLEISFVPGVETFLAYSDGELVGYETHTVRGEHGHLDRLGIHPAAQGLRLGAELLDAAVLRMAQLGARTIGLSTQWNNWRSQALYEHHEFVRLPGSLTFYGRILTSEAARHLETDETTAPNSRKAGA